MCGLFASTDSGLTGRHEQLSYLLDRRGTEGVRWHQGPNGNWYAHSLLPVRGYRPVLQPLVDAHGVVLFSGEIWDVEAGQSDTFFLLDQLRHGGFHRLSALHGTWAVISWSAHTDTLAFATDRFGEQPLHYAVHDDRLYVGSEVKFLVAAGVPLRQARHARPDCIYRFRDRQVVVVRRHSWQSTNRWQSFDPLRLRRRVERSVASQVRAVDQQRLAVLLSGGVDSTIIAYEAAKLGVRRAWTVSVDESAPDAIAAGVVAKRLGLDWTLLLTKPAPPEVGVVTGETTNRSIVEELCLQTRLMDVIARAGVRVILTGTGADEVFVGYAHLLRRIHATELQQRLVTTHYRYDLRAFNKLAMGFAIEPRNPMLSHHITTYARHIHGRVLLGPNRELKWPLRLAYRDILEHTAGNAKLIARETMGAKRFFATRFPDDPRVYRGLEAVLSDTARTVTWLNRIEALPEGECRHVRYTERCN
jgi:asparagine synthase (glutamine-hydrolysing)